MSSLYFFFGFVAISNLFFTRIRLCLQKEFIAFSPFVGTLFSACVFHVYVLDFPYLKLSLDEIPHILLCYCFSTNTAPEVKEEEEVVVENENAEDQEDEGSSSSSSEWQVVDETPKDKPQDMISREQLDQDEETLGRDRDDAMAEEFDEPRK